MPSARPKVLIAGAGIGGLTLAILLEKAGIEYQVIEGSKEVNTPQGSALYICPNIQALFRQLGFFEDFQDLAKFVITARSFNEKRQLIQTLDFHALRNLAGYHYYMITRPKLYEILLQYVPEEKIHRGKRVQRVEQDADKVTVHCEDHSTFTGDILVGADGARSAVRESIYKVLKEENKLPPADLEPAQYVYTCFTGQTREFDVTEYPATNDVSAHYHSFASDIKPYTWSTCTSEQNTICYTILQHHLHVDADPKRDTSGAAINPWLAQNWIYSNPAPTPSPSNGDWGFAGAEEFYKVIENFPCRGGLTNCLVLGDLIDRSPVNQISRVVLEERVRETWFSGRVVLMGDAAHTFTPQGSQGTFHALYDALTLANWINVLPTNTVQDCEKIFTEYREERYPAVQKAFVASKTFNKPLEKTFTAKIARILNKKMPNWWWTSILRRSVSDRPQVSFIPLIEDDGVVKQIPQLSYTKTLKTAVEEGTARGTFKLPEPRPEPGADEIWAYRQRAMEAEEARAKRRQERLEAGLDPNEGDAEFFMSVHPSFDVQEPLIDHGPHVQMFGDLDVAKESAAAALAVEEALNAAAV